ncbi:ubiquitin-like domain-containing protein [Paenibacillus sp. MER TA 81-3]|uniref:ubiquitin-like domain-containing protein n=1 Tax=Paenibacillus sp. MER TA 81-3 TaxID=2939573 RepID=UPI002042281E|nr:3D domain-containing protein [Paenibacillus sp. MER TA 81-3]MCM3342307.1 ubiquitin-like domain-containing protein [Paenibacillus sp. MER TA 81-3]
MGEIVNDETHEPRSSSMSLAMRWKHENVRVVSVIAAVAVVITLITVLYMYGASKKTLSIRVDGQEHAIETRQDTLRNVLDEHAIAVGAHDAVSKPLDTEITDGDKIVIERALPVNVMVDGQKKTHYTTKKSVSDVLVSLQIPVKTADKVYPGQDAAVASNMDIRIVRVSKNVEERKVKVPFQVVKKADPTLLKGKTKTVQKGKEGIVVQKIEKVYEDGKLVYSQLVDKSVQTKQVNQVLAYGTKKEPEVVVLSASSPSVGSGKGGKVGFDYKDMLENVQLTAYTEQEGSPGAKTASGTKVVEGRTIAVDPKLIPLGWWVYIEGVGFRRAEDTGGAVKGKIIDVYYESKGAVRKFGRKKGHTVYVIGPVKPEAN